MSLPEAKSRMFPNAIYANLSCADLDASVSWFRRLFGRDADAAPMAGLVEWYHGEGAGLQIHLDPGKAGSGTLTLIVDDLRAAKTRLGDLAPGEIESGDATSVLRLYDPDGNLVVLAQPGRA